MWHVFPFFFPRYFLTENSKWPDKDQSKRGTHSCPLSIFFFLVSSGIQYLFQSNWQLFELCPVFTRLLNFAKASCNMVVGFSFPSCSVSCFFLSQSVRLLLFTEGAPPGPGYLRNNEEMESKQSKLTVHFTLESCETLLRVTLLFQKNLLAWYFKPITRLRLLVLCPDL